MKNLAKITVLAFAAISFTFASCDSKPAESTEDAVEGAADATEDALDVDAAERDTATVLDQPVEDGVVDSVGNQ